VLTLCPTVFLWYPTLEVVVPNEELPSGLVFSSFMLCIAIGGKLFDLLDNSWVREEVLLLITAAASAVSLIVPTVCYCDALTARHLGNVSDNWSCGRQRRITSTSWEDFSCSR
jgi:hypothetical protein